MDDLKFLAREQLVPLSLLEASFLYARDSQNVAYQYFLRKPRKPLGEDAHFICHDAQTIGVADGVHSWARKGVNAGEYARGLMNHTKKHSHRYNPIIRRRRGSKKGVE
ncbi:unnamed protein product [Prunus armeniaca]